MEDLNTVFRLELNENKTEVYILYNEDLDDENKMWEFLEDYTDLDLEELEYSGNHEELARHFGYRYCAVSYYPEDYEQYSKS